MHVRHLSLAICTIERLAPASIVYIYSCASYPGGASKSNSPPTSLYSNVSSPSSHLSHPMIGTGNARSRYQDRSTAVIQCIGAKLPTGSCCSFRSTSPLPQLPTIIDAKLPTPVGAWLGIVAIVVLRKGNITEPMRVAMLPPEMCVGFGVGGAGVDRHSGWSRRTSEKDCVISQPRSR